MAYGLQIFNATGAKRLDTSENLLMTRRISEHFIASASSSGSIFIASDVRPTNTIAVPVPIDDFETGSPPSPLGPDILSVPYIDNSGYLKYDPVVDGSFTFTYPDHYIYVIRHTE